MKKLHPKAIWLFFLKSLIVGIVIGFWFIPFLAGVLSGAPNRLDSNIIQSNGMEALKEFLSIYLLVIIALIIFDIVLCWIWAKLSYHYYSYELTEDAFRKESGVIWKKYTSIPYERVQNIDIYRGVLARILGLSDLQIQTAGYSAVYSGRGGVSGGNSEGRLPGLEKQVAEQLREELIKRAKGRKNQGL